MPNVMFMQSKTGALFVFFVSSGRHIDGEAWLNW